MTKDKGESKEQKNTDAIIKKHGGEKITRGKDKGKWDMTKGVEAEKTKGKNK